MDRAVSRLCFFWGDTFASIRPSMYSRYGFSSGSSRNSSSVIPSRARVRVAIGRASSSIRGFRVDPGSRLVGWVESSRPTDCAVVVGGPRGLDPPYESRKPASPDQFSQVELQPAEHLG